MKDATTCHLKDDWNGYPLWIRFETLEEQRNRRTSSLVGLKVVTWVQATRLATQVAQQSVLSTGKPSKALCSSLKVAVAFCSSKKGSRLLGARKFLADILELPNAGTAVQAIQICSELAVKHRLLGYSGFRTPETLVNGRACS